MERKSGRRSLTGWFEERFNLTEMFSFLTNFGLFPAEVDTSKPLRQAIDESLQKPMSSYVRWPRVLGILSLLLFAFLGVTGVMLSMYYQPTPEHAHASVTTILRDVRFGWFVHQVHAWGARAFLAILLFRLIRFYLHGLYKKPREAFWIVAILTFLIGTHADFTGQLLPWNQESYWTAVRGVEILYTLPGLGPLLVFLVGGSGIDELVLVRFYFLHVAVLPGMLAVLFYLHFSGVRRLGLSPLERAPQPGPWVFRVHFYTLLILAVLILGVLVTLATLLPAPYGEVADPFHTPPGSRPPWYLLASYGFMEIFPASVPRWVRGTLLEVILVVSILLPFIDRTRGTRPSERRLAIPIGTAVVLLWLLFTWYGHQLEVGP